MISQTLNNRYKITSRLGRGAMGTVYRATDTQSGRDVALKIISSELAVDPSMLERFKREGEALRQLKHLNIVGFIDAFQHDEQSVIVMEHVEGGSLYDLIKKGPLSIERAIQIALDLCDALIRSHRLKIIHRDIKPENILIDNDGTPKLADFGVARLSEGTRMTRSGMQVGTPYYMSPEAWEGRTLDAQADIWSLGIVLFEMLAGQVPFGGDTPLAVMNRINTTPPPDLKKLRSDMPSSLVRIIGRMLTRDKRRRYQTMREVAVDLERGQQMTAPRAKEAKADTSEQRAAQIAALTKNFKAILSPIKSTFTRLVSSIKPAGNRARLYFGIAVIFVLVVASTFFLLRQPGTAPASPPVFSPVNAPITGTVVFSGTSVGEDIFYLYDAANNSFSTIDAGEGTNSDPVMGRSGNLYFTSDRDGKVEIYRQIDGKTERMTYTEGPFESWGPVLGVSGNIYFTSNRDGHAEIYRLINGNTERMTYTEGSFESWGPILHGQEIYFTSNRSDKNEVYLLRPEAVPILNLESWTNLSEEASPDH